MKTASPRAQRLWNRALLCAGGLLVLWALVQFIPAPEFGAEPPLPSDEAGSIAARSESVPTADAPALLTPGRLAALLLLVGGAVTAIVLQRRNASGGGRSTGVPLQPMGTFSMAPNQDLRLVACGEEVLLLGVTPQQISLLKTYPRDQFDAFSSGDDAPPAPAASPAFADVLRQYAGRTAAS